MGKRKSKKSAGKRKEIISRTEKPWGYEELLFDKDGLGMKRIVLKPKQQTSFHYHNEKNEIFFIESGKAVITFEKTKKNLKKGEFVYIKKGAKHQSYNPGSGKLSIIEFGSPHSDSDVVRIEDPYAKIRAKVEKVIPVAKPPYLKEIPSAYRKAVFLDRDGVINENKPDYVKTWNEFKFLPKAKSAIRQLNNAGYLVILITNQQAVGKGLMSEQTLNEIHGKMESELNLAGAHLDAIYYCPHLQEKNCGCRKPDSGMIDLAAKSHEIDLGISWFVGDSLKRDIPLGKSVGCKTIFVNSKGLSPEEILDAQPDNVVRSLMEAVQIIKGSVFGKR